MVRTEDCSIMPSIKVTKSHQDYRKRIFEIEKEEFKHSLLRVLLYPDHQILNISFMPGSDTPEL